MTTTISNLDKKVFWAPAGMAMPGQSQPGGWPGGWGFWDEAWQLGGGPYPTELEAVQGLQQYVLNVLKTALKPEKPKFLLENFIPGILAAMKAQWSHHTPYNPRTGDLDFKYSTEAALEVLLNDVIDYALEHGYIVRAPNYNELTSVAVIQVSPSMDKS